MTRKDFQVIANALRESKPTPSSPPAVHEQWTKTVGDMMRHLRMTNDRFDGVKFQVACGSVVPAHS